MPAEPKHVRPGPQPEPFQLGAAAQLPAGADELGHMRRQVIQALQVVSGEAVVQAGAEALGGLGRVLGDVAGHLLSRQLPGLVVAAGDVADVELPAPAGIALRPTIDRRAGHPNRRDRRLDGLLEQVSAEWLRRWQQAVRAATRGGRVQADHGVEVDGAPALELGHFGIADPHQPAQLPLVQPDEAGQGTLEGDGGPPPQLRRKALHSTWASAS
jgi:hypothetical protein